MVNHKTTNTQQARASKNGSNYSCNYSCNSSGKLPKLKRGLGAHAGGVKIYIRKNPCTARLKDDNK